MVFSSIQFLLVFLPAFLLVYFVTPKKLKNLTLFIFSLGFYAYGCIDTPSYFAIMVASIAINYSLGLGIEKSEKRKKLVLILGLVLNFGMLFFFKYAGFFSENILSLIGREGGTDFFKSIILPLGISFYTFQITSYLIDVYRGSVKAEKNFINLGTYISMFPQLIAGPIVRFEDVQAGLHGRKTTKSGFIEGGELFIFGLGFKVLLANQLGNLWNDVNAIGFDSISTPLAWLGIITYSMQLYFDFYGYSLMAIGLGRMIGFEFPQNFNDPYLSCSMTEFWRRWHITLGTWFREYLYIPLGGNRKGKGRTYFNLFVVWFLTAFWHGADWNFIIWGLFLSACIILEKAFYGKFLEKHRLIGHLYIIILAPLSWLIFAVDDLPKLGVYFQRLIGLGGEAVLAGDYIKYGKLYGLFILAGLFFCTGLPKKILEKIKKTSLMIPLLLAVFGFSLYCIYMGMNDPFMYFRF